MPPDKCGCPSAWPAGAAEPAAGAAAAAAATPLAAGLQPGPGRPQRLYWVPAVGVVPAIEHYRREAGLESVPLVATADVAAVTLSGTGEAQAPGIARPEDTAMAAMQGLELGGGAAAGGPYRQAG